MTTMRVVGPAMALYHRRAVMIQRLFPLLCICFFIGCGRDSGESDPPGSSRSGEAKVKVERVVSLSPAVTDLLVAMNGRDVLVGVSNFDRGAELEGLPRVGDYETVDWERMSVLKPQVIFVQMKPSRVPPTMVERAESMGARVVALQIERLTDIVIELDRVGREIGRAEDAREALAEMREGWEALRQESNAAAGGGAENRANESRVSTLILTGVDGLPAAGRETFLSDALELVGGRNALGDRRGYVSLDRELLIAASPEAIVVLLPEATDAQRAELDRLLTSIPNVPAIRDGRVLVMTESWVLRPGPRVGELARRMGELLGRAPTRQAAPADVNQDAGDADGVRGAKP